MASLGSLTFCRTSGKLGYMSEEHANEAARRIARQHHCYLRVYFHEDCGWWHLTRRHNHNRRRHNA